MGFATIPYVEGTTEKLQRILISAHDIKTTVKLLTTLRQKLSRLKDTIEKERGNGVVYEIPCADCDVK